MYVFYIMVSAQVKGISILPGGGGIVLGKLPISMNEGGEGCGEGGKFEGKKKCRYQRKYVWLCRINRCFGAFLGVKKERLVLGDTNPLFFFFCFAPVLTNFQIVNMIPSTQKATLFITSTNQNKNKNKNKK